MISIARNQEVPSSIGSAAIVFGAAVLMAEPLWPEQLVSYETDRPDTSYSEVSQQVLADASAPRDRFVNRIAAMYMSLSENQQSLGTDFEAAIFSDLDGLYEE